MSKAGGCCLPLCASRSSPGSRCGLRGPPGAPPSSPVLPPAPAVTPAPDRGNPRPRPGCHPPPVLRSRLGTVTAMTETRPLSIPDGLLVELARAKVIPGASAEADRWMAMLNDRLDECVATLDRERMAIEI